MYPGVFELDIPPGHVAGRLRTAPVVVCYLTPGFEETDREVFSDEVRRQALFDQIAGNNDFPLLVRTMEGVVLATCSVWRAV
jgi:hypothetical protein